MKKIVIQLAKVQTPVLIANNKGFHQCLLEGAGAAGVPARMEINNGYNYTAFEA
ncbi:MAG TPA: hypothetical protein VIC26_05585 [Marinagarivorans sp.]